MKTDIIVMVDYENNAETFWNNLDSTYPDLAERLRIESLITLTSDEWAAVTALTGFSDGPVFAPNALIEVST